MATRARLALQRASCRVWVGRLGPFRGLRPRCDRAYDTCAGLKVRAIAARAAIPLLLITALAAGCAQTGSKTGHRIEYACDGGDAIVMHYAPARDAARIEIGGFHFDLVSEPSSGDGNRFGCGMLIVEDRGGSLQVLTENVVTHRNCRPRNVPNQQ